MNSLFIRKSLGYSSIKLQKLSYPSLAVRYLSTRLNKQIPLIHKHEDLRSVLHIKSVLNNKKTCIVIHQVRLLKYSNFGHRHMKTPAFTTIWYFIVTAGLFSIFLDFPSVLKRLKNYFKTPSVEAASVEVENQGGNNTDTGHIKEAEAEEGQEASVKKNKVGFRDRKIVEYENRLRHYSSPDKVFRYFASLQVVTVNGEAEIFMTPDDFIRSLTPGMKQPDGLGLDKFRRVDQKAIAQIVSKESLIDEFGLTEDSVFLKLGSAASRRHFEVAFRMFDTNGDGDVDAEEFDQVALLLRQNTSVGSRHRDTSGNTFKVNSALSSYFFGQNRQQKLTIEKFLDFQEQLQREILTLEFQRKNPKNGKLSEADFASMLLVFAGYPDKKKTRMIKRVRKQYQDTGIGVSLSDYLDFFHFLKYINDVDTALSFYHIAGASIEQPTFKHVARTVAHVELADHVVAIVFSIFDIDGDGQLSNREFVAVMKDRMMRGLEKPKDTGFIKVIQSSLKCANQSRPALWNF